MFNIFIYLNTTFVVEQMKQRYVTRIKSCPLITLLLEEATQLLQLHCIYGCHLEGIYTSKVCPKEDDWNSLMDRFKGLPINI